MHVCVVAQPPFYCRDQKALFDKIRRGKLEFPPTLSHNARSLLGGVRCEDIRVVPTTDGGRRVCRAVCRVLCV
jgi:hypothetical protein